MVYRGFKEPLPECKRCHGSGQLANVGRPGFYDCTSCNGTGIEGNPGTLLYILVGWVVILGGLAWLILK